VSYGTIEKYKGMEIHFDKGLEEFTAIDKDNREVARDKTFSGIKPKIDRFIKSEFGKPIEAIQIDHNRTVKITSKDESDPRGNNIWISFEENGRKERSKTSLRDRWSDEGEYQFCKSTPANLEILKKINEKIVEEERISKEIKALRKQYTEFVTLEEKEANQ
jgi:hypothetical protein